MSEFDESSEETISESERDLSEEEGEELRERRAVVAEGVADLLSSIRALAATAGEGNATRARPALPALLAATGERKRCMCVFAEGLKKAEPQAKSGGGR